MQDLLMPVDSSCPATCAWHTSGRVVAWLAQLGVAGILAQTLFFKFTYAPQTQEIFQDLGGRPAATFIGLVELVAVVLLLWPRLAGLGALLALGTISGAILMHLTRLGISVRDPETGTFDGGLLFGLAITVAFGSVIVLLFRWREVLALLPGGLRSRVG